MEELSLLPLIMELIGKLTPRPILTTLTLHLMVMVRALLRQSMVKQELVPLQISELLGLFNQLVQAGKFPSQAT